MTTNDPPPDAAAGTGRLGQSAGIDDTIGPGPIADALLQRIEAIEALQHGGIGLIDRRAGLVERAGRWR